VTLLRIANSADFDGIAALWQEAFGDSREAVERFFEHFPNCRSFVAEEDGKIVSMVHALPQILSPDTPAAYIYAVATAKESRGRGLCRDLMAFAENELKEKFDLCVLTPGEPSLFRFYETLGYETAFYRSRNPFPGGEEISLEDYAALRENLLTQSHIVYDKAALRYAQGIYGLAFYKTATGIAAAGEHYTAEVLPEDVSGGPYAMAKWLLTSQTLPKAYLGFGLE
jgi:ribosomal protein S18 acetylase RimI-like enzyme